jgi:hypothetical protein
MKVLSRYVLFEFSGSEFFYFILSLLKKDFKSDQRRPKSGSPSVGQKVSPLDRTVVSSLDNTFLDKLITMLSPEQVLYSLNSFLLNVREIQGLLVSFSSTGKSKVF